MSAVGNVSAKLLSSAPILLAATGSALALCPNYGADSPAGARPHRAARSEGLTR